MPSSLSFSATQLLRNKLLVRNLTPYTKPGIYAPKSSPAPGDLILNDYSVVDSPDALIDNDPFANLLYPTNRFGPNGGFNTNINGLINNYQTKSNEGPYGAYPPFTSALQDYSVSFQQKVYVKNSYSPNDKFFRYYDMGDVINVQKNASYWDPPSFRPSTYSPYSVLLEADPVGDNGPVSLDSRLAQIGADRAKYSFQERVNQNVQAQTIGRVNILNGLQDPVQLALIIAGKRPLITRDYQITTGGGNVLSQGMDIVQRIAGFTLPFSPIPGDYFAPRDWNSSQSLTAAAGNGKRGGLFGLFGSRPTSPSQLFLDFTGSGQREQLTQNLDANRFRPMYNTGGGGIISAIGQAITGAFSRDMSQGNYYVGSPQREPEYLTSPPGQVPIDQYGQQVNAPVLGPQVLAKDYEGPDKDFQFGLVGRPYDDDGSITGGFTWVSGKWAPNSGRRQKPGGDYGEQTPNWPSISDDVTSTESVNYEFRPGSILDDTQRLIDSQPNSGARFGHVGNAIQQTSKVFFDGYKEITKGSQVIQYSDGQANVGMEYCRVFTKDTPYYSFNDLQKKEGNIRKFSYSVMDSTYNTNITPGETNITANGVTKYMFSIENLAWRTGHRPGYRVTDLPLCEQGPNGGRVMWFPPYDLDLSEDSRPSFNENTFLGRPEPIYTYKNTSRSGTLKWKIIVDHPSILDLIVNKVLANEGDRAKANSIIDSFFAGCKKYDLYDLALIYNTIPLTELQAWQEVVNNPNVTQEQFKSAVDNVQAVAGTGTQTGVGQSDATPTITLEKYLNFGFYFDNNVPGTNPQLTTSVNFENAYNDYTSSTTKQRYATSNTFTSGETGTFFTEIVEGNFTELKKMMKDMYDLISQKQVSQIVMTLQGSASEIDTKEYNQKLSSRRIDSVLNFMKSYSFDGKNTLAPYIGNQILINQNAVGENLSSITPKSAGGKNWRSVDCTRPLSGASDTFSVPAMACRTAMLTNVTVIPVQTNPQPTNNASEVKNAEDGKKEFPKKPLQDATAVGDPVNSLYKGASKKLLRYLLNECDYFQVLKQDNPFIYDSIKEKLKYFQPSFHSMTPEGLNSRLTFLQQCMRPGDTIPTIGPNGEKLYNDALNTSFGAPPVLVLRVGDFFNTKIIPTSLNYSYEKVWDMNPEGIGFQPMIVTVTLGFNIVGGMGLKNPIDTLQNALSFNYYANTEMYDERAEATEDTSKLDKQVVDALKNQNPVVGVSNTDNQYTNNGGNTIGTFVATGSTASGQTGTLAYSSIMNKVVKDTEGYYNGVINMFDSVLTNYNYGILTMLNYGEKNQGYNSGKFTSSSDLTVSIYGKPQNTQQYVDDSFKELLEDIKKDDLAIFSSTEFANPLITNSQKKLFKKNYSNYVQTYKTAFLNDLTSTVNTLSTLQQDYVFNVDRLNFVLSGSSTGNDGKLDTTNIAIIYKISGTPEVVNGSTIDSLTSMRNDYLSIGNSNNTFLTGLTTANLYSTTAYVPKKPGTFTAPPSFPTEVTKNEYTLREYTIMSRALLRKDLKDGFINALIAGLDQATSNAVKFYYDTSPTSVRVNWQKANDEGKKILTTYKTSDAAKPYIKYTPTFGTTQKRITIFEEDLTATKELKNKLQNIYTSKNDSNKKDPYNFKRKFL